MNAERTYRIAKIESVKVRTAADCGGFRPPKGHLDTQMFPECAGTQADRDIVKKTRENRQRRKKKASVVITKQAWEDAGRKAGWIKASLNKQAFNAKHINDLVLSTSPDIESYVQAAQELRHLSPKDRSYFSEQKKLVSAKASATNAARKLLLGLSMSQESGFLGVDRLIIKDIEMCIKWYKNHPTASQDETIAKAMMVLGLLQEGSKKTTKPPTDIEKLSPQEQASITYSPSV